MQNICGMHGFQSSQCLVDEILAVVVREFLGSDNSMHIRLHKLLDEVDLREGFEISGSLDVKN